MSLIVQRSIQMSQFQQSICEYWLAPLLSPFWNLFWCVQLDSFSSWCMVLQSGYKNTDISKGKHWQPKFQILSEMFHLHFSSGCSLSFHEPWSCSRAQNTMKEIWWRQSVKYTYWAQMTWNKAKYTPANHLDMLGNMFIILLLVFEAPVTGVTKMGKLWFLLIFVLWVIDRSIQHILPECTAVVWQTPLWSWSWWFKW